jgi:hypothetical protein
MDSRFGSIDAATFDAGLDKDDPIFHLTGRVEKLTDTLMPTDH